MSYCILTLLVDGRHERACLYPVFLFPNTNCQLGFVVIYASGKVECGSEQYDLNGIRLLIDKGLLRTSVDEGERILIPELISIEASNVIPIVQEEEFLKEIADIVRELNGEPTTSDICRSTYKDYMRSPSEENRLRLQEAYENVPRHLDCWLLGFDEKDIPIRKAIYGNTGKP